MSLTSRLKEFATSALLNLAGDDYDKRAYSFENSGYSSFNVGELELVRFRANLDLFYKFFLTNTDIAACVREIQDSFGNGGWDLYTANMDDKAPDNLKLDVHNVLNSAQSFTDLCNQFVVDYLVGGGEFWELLANGKKVVGINPVDPRTVAVVTDTHGDVIRYVQKPWGSEPVTFTDEEMIYLKRRRHPKSAAIGLSVLESAIWEVQTDAGAMYSNYAFFKNNAVPAVQFILDEKLTTAARQEAIKYIKEEFRGAINRHKSTAMFGVKDVKTLNITNKEMEFMEGRRFSTEKVCEAFGVPKFKLGLTETVNNNNGVELNKNFIRETIKPIEDYFQEMINRELLTRMGIAGQVVFKFNEQVWEDEASLEDRARNEYQVGILTLRQYKMKTHQKVTAEDESNPLIDKHVIFNGTSVIIAEDIEDAAEETPEQKINEEQNRIKTAEILTALRTRESRPLAKKN